MKVVQTLKTSDTVPIGGVPPGTLVFLKVRQIWVLVGPRDSGDPEFPQAITRIENGSHDLCTLEVECYVYANAVLESKERTN